MNVLWQAKRDARRAGRPTIGNAPNAPHTSTKGKRPRKPKVKSAAPPPPSPEYPCEHRGGLLGQLDCACGGKSAVLACTLHGRCLRHAPGKPWPLRFVPLIGEPQNLSRDQSPKVCAMCDDRPRTSDRPPDGTADTGMDWTTNEQFLSDAMRLGRMLTHVWPLKGVLGVPRSGQRAAAIVAGLLQCPTGFVDANQLEWFPPSNSRRVGTPQQRPGTVIVIDDSSATGASISRAVATAKRQYDSVISAVLYQFETSRFLADHYVHKFPGRPAWTWHEYYVCGSQHATRAAWDCDGVLCPNPTPQDMASEDAYVRWLRAVPCIRPVRPFAMGAVITGRCERFRAATEDWLARHGMRANALIMHPDVQLLTGPPGVVHWKAAEWASRPNLRWFLESEPDIARRLAEMVGRPAVCVPTGQVFERGRQAA